MAGDPYWNNVVLAMHLNDVALADLKGRSQSISGAVQTMVDGRENWGGAAAYFDGSNDYITMTDGTDWAFGTGDFTIEFWVYRTVVGAYQPLVAHRYSSDASNYWYAQFTNTNTLQFVATTAGTTITNIVTVTTIPANTWTHIAVVRSAGVVKLYAGGVADNTVTSNTAAAYPDVATGLVIGRALYDSTGVSNFAGYLSDLRITKGLARYLAAFTPPSTPFPDRLPQLSGTVKDSTDAFVSRPVLAFRRSDGASAGATTTSATDGAFLLDALDDTAHFAVALPVEGDLLYAKTTLLMALDSAGFPDAKANVVTINGTVTLEATAGPWGGGAALFSGASSTLSVADGVGLRFGLGDFTFEFWQRYSDYSGYFRLMAKGAGAAGGWLLSVEAGDGNLILSHGTFFTSVVVETGSVVETDVWYHIAIVRSATATRLYRNGVLVASRQNYAADLNNSSPLIVGGMSVADTIGMKGHLYGLRFTKGVARYLHNFTPPAGPYPSAVAGGAENALILDNLIPV